MSHNPCCIPAHSKWISHQIENVDQDDAGNGEQKDFSVAQKGQGAVSQMRNIPVPRQRSSVKCIGQN